MGIYIDSVIGKDEQVLHQAKISMTSYWLVWLIGGLLTLQICQSALVSLFF